MVINLTELPLMNWSDAQILAAKKLASDGVIRGYELPLVRPTDPYIKVQDLAWETDTNICQQFCPDFHPRNIEAIILQGEPVFVYHLVNAMRSHIPNVQCYSPCYDSDGNFVQFRRF